VTQQKAGIQGPWLYDRRVRWLLELSIDEGEQVRFGIEGMDGQCIIALDERLLVIKPGFVRGTDFGGLAASIYYADITSIETNVAASNPVVQAAFQGCYPCCCCCCCCCCRCRSRSRCVKGPSRAHSVWSSAKTWLESRNSRITESDLDGECWRPAA
jgi:hypothetical protein